MSARERGNIWPVVCVIAVALVVLLLPLIIRHKQASARMAAVDAQVIIGDVESGRSSDRDATMYRWPDSEVPRTAERLRDLTAVAIAASTYVAQRAMSSQAPRDASEITTAITKRQLVPPEWLINQSGVLRTSHGALYLRYSPNILRVEVVSVPATRTDGPAMLIRIPDDENTGITRRYFESMQVDSIIYPTPFAPIPEIIGSGWTQRFFKQASLDLITGTD
jgi:hypothetical protein